MRVKCDTVTKIILWIMALLLLVVGLEYCTHGGEFIDGVIIEKKPTIVESIVLTEDSTIC